MDKPEYWLLLLREEPCMDLSLLIVQKVFPPLLHQEEKYSTKK